MCARGQKSRSAIGPHRKRSSRAIAWGSSPKLTVLDEKKIWMRPLVDCTAEDRAKFWREIGKLRPQEPPHKMRKAPKRSLPEGSSDLRFAPRREGRRRPGPAALCRASGVVRRTYPARGKGAGALGLGLGAPRPEPEIAIFLHLANGEFLAPRPLSAYPDSIIVRRIAPDLRKIELDRAAELRSTPKSLEAMGFDLGAIHAVTKSGAGGRAQGSPFPPGRLVVRGLKVAAAAVQKDLEA